MGRGNALRALAVVAVWTLLAPGCAVLQPYREGELPRKESAPARPERVWIAGQRTLQPRRAPGPRVARSEATLADAVAYAESTRGRYLDAIQENTLFNRTLGTVLVAAGTAAAIVGATGGSADTVTGLALGGAGAFGLREIWYREPRLMVYAKGARAVDCAVGTFSGMMAADAGELDTSVRDLQGSLAELDGLLSRVPPGVQGLYEVQHASLVSLRGHDTLARGEKAIVELKHAAQKLITAVRGIHDAVVEGLIRTEPDIAEIVGNLNRMIPSYARLLGGDALDGLTVPEDTEKAKVTGETARLLSQLAAAAATVERHAARVRLQITEMAGPDEEALQVCLLDTHRLAQPFRPSVYRVVIEPGADQGGDPGAPGAERAVGSVRALGGVAPYHAEWKATPPAGVSLARGTEGPNPPFLITVLPGTAEERLTLTLLDDDGGRVDVEVWILVRGGLARSVTTTSTTPTSTTTASTEPPARLPDEQLRATQGMLIARECLSGFADGFWGPATADGVAAWAAAAGTPLDDLRAVFTRWPPARDESERLTRMLREDPSDCREPAVIVADTPDTPPVVQPPVVRPPVEPPDVSTPPFETPPLVEHDPPPAPPDEGVLRVQQGLVTIGCLPEQLAGEPSATGVWGEASQRAYERYVANLRLTLAEVEADVGAPGDPGFPEQLWEQVLKFSVSDSDFDCS